MPTTLEQVRYAGWPNCLRLTDGHTELIITTDVGPRIIRCAPVGQANLFHEVPRQRGRRDGVRFRLFGGHRLWVAPELRPDTYAPDNVPVEWSWDGRVLHLRSPVNAARIQKEIIVRWVGRAIHLEHVIINRGKTVRRLAPWSLSVMAPGGFAVMPQERSGSHLHNLLPARPLVLWKYTNMQDPRWTWGRQLMQLRQDPRATTPQKVGFLNRPGWLAYVLPHATFIKWHTTQDGATYPDMGCNAELFTNHNFLELETLGPLADVKPGQALRHHETWQVFTPGLRPGPEAQLQRALRPLLSRPRTRS